MHRARWRQITAIFHEALARDDRTRDTFRVGPRWTLVESPVLSLIDATS